MRAWVELVLFLALAAVVALAIMAPCSIPLVMCR